MGFCQMNRQAQLVVCLYGEDVIAKKIIGRDRQHGYQKKWNTVIMQLNIPVPY